MSMQGKNARREGCHGAQGEMARAPMVDALIPDTVFLLGEGERCKRGSVKIGGGTRLVIKGAAHRPRAGCVLRARQKVGARLCAHNLENTHPWSTTPCRTCVRHRWREGGVP